MIEKRGFFRDSLMTVLFLFLLIPSIVHAENTQAADFAKAISDIGTADKTLTISTEQVISKSLIIPANIQLNFLKGGMITVSANNVTLTILGPFEAGLFKVFNITGQNSNVRFGDGTHPALVTEVYPEWWGAKADNSIDSTAALTSAINSVDYTTISLSGYPVNSGITVGLQRGVYRFTNLTLTAKYKINWPK